MSTDGEALLETLLRQYEKQEAQPEAHTFFGIIGRARDENLISRMLAYLIQHNRALSAALFAFYAEKKSADGEPIDAEPESITCEKNMGSGRADIFIEAGGYTLTIENKVNSWEHGDQTKRYYQYVSKNYSDRKNGFIFLKPDYNGSHPSDEHFAEMRYSEFLELMEKNGTGDRFEKDFKRHIKKYFITWNGEIMETDEMILQNYTAFKNMLSAAESKYAAAKQEVERALERGELLGGAPIHDYRGASEKGALVSDNKKDIGHRIYKNQEWYDDASDYYFYLELVMPPDPREITTQMVVHHYSNSKHREKSDVRNFINGRGNTIIEGRWENSYFVSSPRGKFESKAKILSDTWMEELYEYIKSTFKEYLPQMERLVEEFHAWRRIHAEAAIG